MGALTEVLFRFFSFTSPSQIGLHATGSVFFKIAILGILPFMRFITKIYSGDLVAVVCNNRAWSLPIRHRTTLSLQEFVNHEFIYQCTMRLTCYFSCFE